MKEHNKTSMKVLGLGIIILIMVLIVIIIGGNQGMPELLQGEAVPEFCSEMCGNYPLLSSNNNSEYNFIRCDCIRSTQVDSSKYSASSKINTFTLYFNSTDLNEITEQESKSRILKDK